MKALYALVFAGGFVPLFAATDTAFTRIKSISVVTSAPPAPHKAARRISKVTLQPESGALLVGGTLQVAAIATYSDGTTATLPDTLGDVVTTWNSSNYSIASISPQGLVTALAQGAVHITAMVGSLAAQPMVVAVSRATPEVSAAPEAEPADRVDPDAPIRDGASTNDNAPTAGPSPSESPSTPGSPTAPESPSTQPESPAPQGPFAPVTPGPQPQLAGPRPAAPAGPLPDNFIGPFWTTVSPAGGSASISNSHLFLGVPGGANHDPFSATNQAVRVVQSIGDVDFDVAMKIDSPLVAADGNTSQGLMVLAANGDFLTFALTTDGNNIGLMGQTVTAGASTIVLDDSAFSEYQNPTYLRLRRSGSSYVALYSVDGATWKQAASFTDTMATASVGPFASNFNSTPANALPVVMAVNWFEVQ